MSHHNDHAKMERNGNEGVPDGVGGLSPDLDRQETLNRIRTASSVSMSPELFEKLYLTPANKVRGELRRTFANPTPIALVGFLMSLTPLCCDLMGWRGNSVNSGPATIGVYFFMGGLLMFVGGLLEWVLGNSFAAVVFCTFGGFWFSYGATLAPAFAAFASYAPNGQPGALGAQTRSYNVSIGWWFLCMGLVCTIFLICALRTNVVFCVIFLSLMLTFFLLVGAHFSQGQNFTGNAAIANRCYVGAGAAAFVTSMAGWYLLTAIMLGIVDFPIQIPVGDLTGIVKGRSERRRAKGRDP